MNELALFAGAGGGLLASNLLGWRTVCYVEWDKYAVDVLKARIADGCLDDAPIWDDCFTFDGYPWAGLVDVISAGFPCQPFSLSGRGLSENDPRNGWPAIKRILGEVRPSYAFLENVPGLLSKPYIRRIFGDLAEIGYSAEWGTLSASSIGALHKRERVWIVAYSNSLSWLLSNSSYYERETLHPRRACSSPSPSDSNCKYGKNQRVPISTEKKQSPVGCFGSWLIEPGVGRVANGVAHRVDRLTALGNGQVPQVARTAWDLLMSRIGNHE